MTMTTKKMLTDDERKIIRKRLRYYITVTRESMAELSYRIGKEKSTVSKVISGQLHPDVYWGDLCRVLGIPLLRLLYWTDEEYEEFLTERLKETKCSRSKPLPKMQL